MEKSTGRKVKKEKIKKWKEKKEKWEEIKRGGVLEDMMISDINMKAPWCRELFSREGSDDSKSWYLQRNNRTSRHSENLTEAAYVLREQLRTTSAVFLVHTGKSYILMEMPIWKAHTLHYRGGKTIFQVPWYSLIWFFIYFLFSILFRFSSAFYFVSLQHIYFVSLQHFISFLFSILIYFLFSILFSFFSAFWFAASKPLSKNIIRISFKRLHCSSSVHLHTIQYTITIQLRTVTR